MTTTTDTPTNALETIVERAQLLSHRRSDLAVKVQTLSDMIEELKAHATPGIRQSIKQATAALNALEADIQAHPELFLRPRSMEAHGIKFGYAKGKGSLLIADEATTVKLIKRHLPDQADVLIATVETPVKAALMSLPAADLKRIGCEIKGTGDQVFIKPAEPQLDKMVKALVSAEISEQKGGV